MSFTNSEWNLHYIVAWFMPQWWLKTNLLPPPWSLYNGDWILNNSAYWLILKLWLKTKLMRPPWPFTSSDWNLHIADTCFMPQSWMNSNILPPTWSFLTVFNIKYFGLLVHSTTVTEHYTNSASWVVHQQRRKSPICSRLVHAPVVNEIKTIASSCSFLKAIEY